MKFHHNNQGELQLIVYVKSAMYVLLVKGRLLTSQSKMKTFKNLILHKLFNFCETFLYPSLGVVCPKLKVSAYPTKATSLKNFTNRCLFQYNISRKTLFGPKGHHVT